MNTKQEAKIITLKDLDYIRKPLPESWKKAAGLMRHKRKALQQHLKRVHEEWDRK